MAQATEAIEELRQAVDALIIIPNDKLLQSRFLHAHCSLHSAKPRSQNFARSHAAKGSNVEL